MLRFLLRLLRTREFAIGILILFMMGLVACVDPAFFSFANVRDILVRSAPTAIVACGLMLVVVTGEIDISVGSLMGLLAGVMGVMASAHHWNWPLVVAMPLVLLVGTLIGLLTGTLVTLGRVPSIIATLGLLTALRGTTTMVMDGENIDGLPESLQQVTKYGLLGIPLSLWVAVVVIFFTLTLIHQMPLGKRLFALGSSSHSAKMVGLPNTQLKLFTFTYVGFLTALATIVDVPRLPKIESGIGNGFELLVVTCVVVGGVSISGGRGRLTGVLLAVILLTIIRPVLTFLDIGEAGEKWTKAIQGGLIILAMVADRLATRERPSVLGATADSTPSVSAS